MEEKHNENTNKSIEKGPLEQSAENRESRREFLKKNLQRAAFAAGAMALVSIKGEKAFACHSDSPHQDTKHKDVAHANVRHQDRNHDDWHGDLEYRDHLDCGWHEDHYEHWDSHLDHSEHVDIEHEDTPHKDVAHVDHAHGDHNDHTDYPDHTNHSDECDYDDHDDYADCGH